MPDPGFDKPLLLLSYLSFLSWGPPSVKTRASPIAGLEFSLVRAGRMLRLEYSQLGAIIEELTGTLVAYGFL